LRSIGSATRHSDTYGGPRPRLAASHIPAVRVHNAGGGPGCQGFGGVVGGYGSGDTVPAWLEPGSVVINRRATAVMRGHGYQRGGVVVREGGGGTTNQSVTIKVDIHLSYVSIRSDADIKRLADELSRHFERQTRSGFISRRMFP
jgi:hypothetical protein